MKVSKFKFQQKSRGCAHLLCCCIKSGGPAWHAGCSYLKTVKKWDESNVESLRKSSFSRACRWGTFDVRTLRFSTTWESTKSAMVSASPCLTRVRCLGIVFDVNGWKLSKFPNFFEWIQGRFRFPDTSLLLFFLNWLIMFKIPIVGGIFENDQLADHKSVTDHNVVSCKKARGQLQIQNSRQGSSLVPASSLSQK